MNLPNFPGPSTNPPRSPSVALRVGILGGGQLARMLVEAALPLGLEPVVFVDDPLAPAARISPAVHPGGFDDAAALRAFLSGVSTVVFENEFVDTARLGRAAQSLAVVFAPALDTLHRLQDKLSQKIILEQLGIPSARYRVVDKSLDLDRQIQSIREQFRRGCVFKWSRMGYDGKGVLLCSPDTEPAAIHRFCEHGFARPAEVYVEERIEFRRELAMVAVRSKTGEFDAWPLVVSEQESGICRRVWGPATNFGVAAALEQQARDFARRLAEELAITGVFALEMFETGAGELLINEIAPRVHNSGHYTQDGAQTSQFTNHWRGVLGWPLGATRTPPAFAMLNLLGPEGVRLQKAVPAMPRPAPGISLHWYEKAGIRPHRKLGHLNRAGAAPEEMPAILESLEAYGSSWENYLRSLA